MNAMCSFRYKERFRKLPQVPKQCRGGKCAEFYPQFTKYNSCKKWDIEEIAEQCMWYWRWHKLDLSNGSCRPSGWCSDRCPNKPIYLQKPIPSKPSYIVEEDQSDMTCVKCGERGVMVCAGCGDWWHVPEYFKLGESYDPEGDRLPQLQLGNPRELMMTKIDKNKDESTKKGDYKPWNKRSEWYYLTHKIKDKEGLQ